jgi:hypothetical protein
MRASSCFAARRAARLLLGVETKSSTRESSAGSRRIRFRSRDTSDHDGKC